jgi:MFS family permease
MTVRLGLRANASQFTLLVAVNALVGALVGVERSVLPVIGTEDFGLASKAAVLSFIAGFGVAKAGANLFAGIAAARFGRKRLLVAGWLLALPVAPLIAFAPGWEWIVAANVLLGASQGLAWSMTVVMKLDLVGGARRGLALGLNEAAGYTGVAIAAFATGALAASYAPRTVVWVAAAVIAAIGTIATLIFVRDTGAHVSIEAAGVGRPTLPPGGVLRACGQAGLVNNLNDAVAWGLVPLYLAAHGASLRELAIVTALYPAIWGLGQVLTGWASDFVGRKPLIVAGMLVQAVGLAVLVVGGGTYAAALGAAALLGAGTALVYPTLLAAVSDAVDPLARAQAVGVYRFWRDSGFVLGAVGAGIVADAFGMGAAIVVVAALTAASGIWVARVSFRSGSILEPAVERRYGWGST